MIKTHVDILKMWNMWYGGVEEGKQKVLLCYHQYARFGIDRLLLRMRHAQTPPPTSPARQHQPTPSHSIRDQEPLRFLVRGGPG
jgi:hypothetical protein